MHAQLAVEPRDVFLDCERLVGGQSIQDQVQGLATPAQHVHAQWANQGVRIGGKPEETSLALMADAALMLWRWPGTGTTGGCARAPHVLPWTASARKPDSSQKTISALVSLAWGTIAGYVSRGQRALASGSRWSARCKGFCGVRPSRASRAPIEAKLNRMPNRCAISSRTIWRVHKPQSNPYGRGVFPVTHLPLLPRGQGPWAAGRGTCRKRVESVAPPAHRRQPARDCAPVKALAGDHLAWALARAHTLDRHRADGLQRAVIQCPSVLRHSGTEYDTIRMCRLFY